MIRCSIYIPVFMGLAVTFVPVLFFFGLAALIVPTGYGIVWLLELVFLKQDWRLAIGVGIHVAIYLAVFYLLAWASHCLLMRIPWRTTRWIGSALIFTAIVSCGFLRVLTYQSIQGCGGTYDFWTAVDRYIEKKRL